MTDKHQEIVEFFGRHLVAIWFSVALKTDPPNVLLQTELWSGTYIEIDGVHYLLTAGHCVEEMEKVLSSGLVTRLTSKIVDNLGPKAIGALPIPMAYEATRKYWVDANGFDYALLEIPANTIALLAANGLKPISEAHWQHQRTLPYDGYAMLGIPAEKTTTSRGNDDQLYMQFEPTMLFLKPPTDSPEKRDADPRFMAIVAEYHELSSIVGMSGGPIFGFVTRSEMRYWLMAIQSAWNRSTRETYATLIVDIVEHFRANRSAI